MTLKDKLTAFFSNKLNLGLSLALLLLVIGGFFGVRAIQSSRQQAAIPLEEVEMEFDPEGTYALLYPRRDGNALVLNIKRVSSYENISYELAYQSNGIDRGVQGKLNLDSKKNEYSQEILLGTCSTVDTYNINHCVFDPNVEFGTLTLRIQKGTKVYKMITQLHLQKPDVALGEITSGDSHFTYKTTASRQDLSNVGYSIVNDLSGAPKLPEGKQVFGKVYALNIPTAKVFPDGNVTVETIENIPEGATLARYDEGANKWDILDSKVGGSKITAKAKSSGIFTVLVNNTSK